MKSNSAIKSVVARLVLVTIAMFGFGFALVPLYDMFCDITGLNGKTNDEAFIPLADLIDTSRQVTVQFVATNNDYMSWEFKPQVFKIKVHPGEEIETTFYAKNPSSKPMMAQAIPSVSPSRAASYFLKTECFCFNQQQLAAGEAIDMPLKFIVDRDLPTNVSTITLSYTLFDITDGGAVNDDSLANR